VRAFEQGGALEVFDGFKRLRAARALGLRDLCTVVADIGAIEATVQMRELHAGRGLTALEEAWMVRALHREHHESQGAIAARLRCHKSWVCRRLLLVEALDTSVQGDVRLGLLSPRAAVLVAALPRGNQSPAAGTVIHRGLTVRQTATFVRELVDAREPRAQGEVLARWRAAGPPRARGRGSSAGPDALARDVSMMSRCAGRLQARLAQAPIDPDARALRETLGELGSVLGALRQMIAGALATAEAS
jgi:ParB-like chromosome segregation protein Spo0J